MKKLKVIALTLCLNIVLSIAAIGQSVISHHWYSLFPQMRMKQETNTWCVHACNAMLGASGHPTFKYNNQKASVAAYLSSMGCPCSNQPPTYYDPLTLEDATNYGGVRFGDIQNFLKFKKYGFFEKCYVGKYISTHNNKLPAVLVVVSSGGGHAMVLYDVRESYLTDSFMDRNRSLQIDVCDPWTGNMKTMYFYGTSFDYSLNMNGTYYVFYNF